MDRPRRPEWASDDRFSRRRELYLRAAPVFRAHGYGGATLKALASACGLSTSTMLGHVIVGLSYFAITATLPLVAWGTFRRRRSWQSYARPSLAVGAILVALFFVGPILGEDRVGAWQRAMLLLALTWQAAVALHLRAQLAGAGAREAAEPRLLGA